MTWWRSKLFSPLMKLVKGSWCMLVIFPSQCNSQCLGALVSWNTEFAVIWMAFSLSQYITCNLVHSTCRSLRKYINHGYSQVAAPNAWYSAFDDDLDNVSCFLVQEIYDLTRKKHVLDMDLLVSIHLAQSTSEKLWMLKTNHDLGDFWHIDSRSSNVMILSWI